MIGVRVGRPRLVLMVVVILCFDVVEIRTVILLLAHCNSNDGCGSQAVSCVTDASE